MEKFIRKDLEFFLPETFKGLTKNYILQCIFNDKIQEEWKPGIGDLIVGCTGNIFVISSMENRHNDLGGMLYFFGGGSCNRDGGNVLDSTFCYTANEKGKYIHPLKGEQSNLNHSSIRDFKYVPYPHEI